MTSRSARTHRTVSCVLIALMATGCSRTVVVPREDYDRASHEYGKTHRLDLQDSSYYLVRRFAVTDSTVVVEELYSSDKRYGTHARTPIVLTRQDLTSISRVETNWTKTGLVFLGVSGLLVAALWVLLVEVADPVVVY